MREQLVWLGQACLLHFLKQKGDTAELNTEFVSRLESSFFVDCNTLLKVVISQIFTNSCFYFS